VKLAFSTLACPNLTMPHITALAAASGYDGIELRFVEDEDSLWKLPAFQGEGLSATRQLLRDSGLTVACVDTSCRFHSPNAVERNRWLEEGVRMADLAAELSAPAIRVFGDTIQPGADRASTREWISDSIQQLIEKTKKTGVEVWLETHGDFASGAETASILNGTSGAGVIWDPANCLLEAKESPTTGASILRSSIRHVHIKDLHAGKHVLTGDGDFPLLELRDALIRLDYEGFLSFEWEKKWHPEIPDAEIALPHFVRWFKERWNA
jgi:sugar phosphate isomerase/epimerase